MYDILHSLSGANVVVVGGASGIGRGVVEGLGRASSRVVVLDIRKPDPYDAFSPTDQPVFIPVDIRRHDDVEAAYQEVDRHLESLDAVVNTVGVSGADQPSEHMTEDVWQHSMSVNLSGIFWSCQQAARRMLPTGAGAIVNFSSLCGLLVANPYRTVHYHTAKAALNSLTRALGVEWGARGVRINAIAPGAFPTAAPGGLWEGDEERLRAHHAKVAGAVPLRRLGVVDEIVPLVLFLASSASSYITGQTYAADGGRGLLFD